MYKSGQVFKRDNYKTSHCIGSRKVSEKCVSYSDTYPVYESVVLAYLKHKDMKSQSSKTVPKVSKNEVHEQNGSKGLPAKRKAQVKDIVNKNNNNKSCVLKSPAKHFSGDSCSKQNFKESSVKTDPCKTSTSSPPKSTNKNKKCVPCKKAAFDQKGLSSNSVSHKNLPNVSVCIKNINHINKKKSKNRIKSIERKMSVKRKLEVLSCKLEENNNMVIDVKPKRRKVTPKQKKSKIIKNNNKSKTKLDISVIPGKRKKREASLNASALVNIYFEKEPISPKKIKQSPNGSVPESDLEYCATHNAECKLDTNNKKEEGKKVCASNGAKKVSTSNSEKSCKPSTKLKEKSLTKKMLTLQKTNGMKAKLTKSSLNAVSLLKDELTKNKIKSSKSLDLKKVKHKLNSIRKSTDEIAGLNAQALMASSKYLKPSTERAARTDRFCLSWIRQPCLTHSHHNSAHWVEGWGKTCCTIAAQARPDATSLVSKPNHQIFDEGKSSSVSMQMSTQSHLSNVSHYEPATLSQMETTQVIHIEPIQKITHLEMDIPSDDRPSSVVDVVGAHTPIKPVSRTSLCINSVFPQDSTCVQPCNGFCCSSEEYMCGQYQSMTLGGIGSLNTVQMMSYPQPPYRSAFSVPYAHAGLQTYGFYHGNFFQPNPSSLMQQPIHNMKPCLLPHHVPVQVPHVQVKVLIHNPDTSHECAFPDGLAPSDHSIIIDDQDNAKGKKVTFDGKTKNTLKQKKKTEKKCLTSPGDDDVAKKAVIKQQAEESCHGWSWSGEPEWKLVQNIQVDGPPIRRKCYSAICHDDGDIINIRDCVLLRSGPRKTDIPFIAKVGAFWEHPDDGEMMMSLLWYYRPEHTEMGRQPHNQEQEIFASKHRDENSVACIEDKAYVLTSGEYARYKAEISRLKQGACCRNKVVPEMGDVMTICNKLISTEVDPTTVFVCHQVYDFRQKRILKNPS